MAGSTPRFLIEKHKSQAVFNIVNLHQCLTNFVEAVARAQAEGERAKMVGHQEDDHIDRAARWVDTSGYVAHHPSTGFISSRMWLVVGIATNATLALVRLPLVLSSSLPTLMLIAKNASNLPKYHRKTFPCPHSWASH